MKTILIVICLVVVGCSPSPTPINEGGSVRETYSDKYGDYLEIATVRDCKYVLWYNGSGSDMEHYEGCTNPKHCK